MLKAHIQRFLLVTSFLLVGVEAELVWSSSKPTWWVTNASSNWVSHLVTSPFPAEASHPSAGVVVRLSEPLVLGEVTADVLMFYSTQKGGRVLPGTIDSRGQFIELDSCRGGYRIHSANETQLWIDCRETKRAKGKKNSNDLV